VEIRMKQVAALSIVIAFVATPVSAQQTATPGRYSFVPVGDGALRLDTVTGEVALCLVVDRKAGCAPAAETLRHRVDDITLRDRIAGVEERMAAIESGALSGETGRRNATMDRVALLAERMMERLIAIVREMKREMTASRL
jgi:hypothetical protein